MHLARHAEREAKAVNGMNVLSIWLGLEEGCVFYYVLCTKHAMKSLFSILVVLSTVYA